MRTYWGRTHGSRMIHGRASIQTGSGHPRAGRSEGLTRIEVIVVVAMLLGWGLMVFPAWGHGVHKSKALACMENLRRVSLGWVLYANDHDGVLVRNVHGGDAMNPLPGQAGWASGWLDWTTGSANTNQAFLVDPRYALLADYVERDPLVYQCPEDNYLSGPQRARGWTARTRSYSANIVIGPGNAEVGPFDATFAHVTRMSDFRNPAPLDCYVFVEEHPDSINDPGFFSPFVNQWIDVPASFHLRAANFTFADGHGEIRRWQNSNTVQQVRYSFSAPRALPNDPDIAWLRDHTPRR